MQQAIHVLWREFGREKHPLTNGELSELREMSDALWEMQCNCQYLISRSTVGDDINNIPSHELSDEISPPIARQASA